MKVGNPLSGMTVLAVPVLSPIEAGKSKTEDKGAVVRG